ncbi:MAG: hypothetical protein M3498_08105 [Deinococcota bacterium]|nr:hypothetical protein [Deinococcota bacterium]
MTRARAHPKHPLRVLLSLGLVLLLAAALPLTPYLLSEGGLTSSSSASGHAHHTDHPDKAEVQHLHCLKCVMAVSSLPAATTAAGSVLPARGSLATAYITPHLKLLFDPNAGARAPPVHLS